MPGHPRTRQALLGAAVTSTAVAVRLLSARRRARSRTADQPAVPAADGVGLHVEVDGDPDASLTVVFSHGFAATLGEYDRQRGALRGRARLVLYDQRGHGRSGWGSHRRATIEQLGNDLGRVLDDRGGTGPIVLVGHSMGGMAILALASARPTLFGDRVAGVCLLASSAGHLVEGLAGRTVGRLLVGTRLLRGYLGLLWLAAPVLDRLAPLRSSAGHRFVRHRLVGERPPPATVGRTQQMLAATSRAITSAFYLSFVHHDRVPALHALRNLPTLVLCGGADRVIPRSHSYRIAAELGDDAELVVVPGAGHMVNLTHPDAVHSALRRLVDRAEARHRVHRRSDQGVSP